MHTHTVPPYIHIHIYIYGQNLNLTDRNIDIYIDKYLVNCSFFFFCECLNLPLETSKYSGSVVLLPVFIELD